MKGNSQQTFNGRFTLMFALILLGVRGCIALFILFNFDNFLTLSKEYGDLFIILFGGIGYFSTSIVTFYKKALVCKKDPNAISELEKVSPLESLYYPVVLFLTAGLFVTILGSGENKTFISSGAEEHKTLSFLVPIVASVIYLLIAALLIYWDGLKKKTKRLIKCLKEKSDH